ncbi:hypothetical protein PLANPX_5197 [Lacipirellula parvula]|uniref:Uncharacterized protein n=1 Tax=Lacipirellula parvula TaxID=2650471 RepID=A0A5K7XGR4_9BACT|nr:hypothetical protein PLANPX_5197 [Lacipirellula parvula]
MRAISDFDSQRQAVTLELSGIDKEFIPVSTQLSPIQSQAVP